MNNHNFWTIIAAAATASMFVLTVAADAQEPAGTAEQTVQPKTSTNPAAAAGDTKTAPQTQGATATDAKPGAICKGLDEKPCRVDTTCFWIAASKGKDGSDVAAHCRARPKHLVDTCKGLEETACGAAAGCSWVPASKGKDGVDVSASCRAKTKRTTAKVKAPSKKNAVATEPAADTPPTAATASPEPASDSTPAPAEAATTAPAATANTAPDSPPPPPPKAPVASPSTAQKTGAPTQLVPPPLSP